VTRKNRQRHGTPKALNEGKKIGAQGNFEVASLAQSPKGGETKKRKKKNEKKLVGQGGNPIGSEEVGGRQHTGQKGGHRETSD